MDNLVFKLTVQDDGSAKITAFEKKIQGLQKETLKSTSKLKDAFNNVDNSIVDFTAKAGKEFIQFSKESVKAFLEFENAMVAVAKTTGIPKENMGKFSEQIRETAVNLKGLGKGAAVQIANIAEVAGQLGIASGKLAKGQFDAASKEILGFATVIAKAKIALPEFTGGVEQIATVAAKQIQLYGETSDAAEQYLSVMNKLSDTTAATAVDLAGFLKNFTIAPVLKIQQEEAASWGATFVSLGQNAYDAATRMQSAYSQVLAGSRETNSAISGLFSNNEKMAKQLEELAGRSVKIMENGKVAIGDYSNLAREAIGKDANEAMKLFVTALSEVESTSERASIATDIFGRVGAKAILTLIPELPKLSDAAEEAATVFLSTNEQALDSLAKMSGVSRKQFSDNADFMKAVYAKDMPDAIRVLVEEINKIDDEQEKARVASEVFGEDWQVAMNKAQGGVKLFDESLKTAQTEIEAVKNGTGSLQKEYDTALDKVGTSFSELTAITDDIKLQWGAPLAEALSAGIKLMIPVIDELRKNFMGVVEEFGRELGGESLASAFRQTAEAFKGSIEEMGANADTFIAALKEQFTLPNLFATAMSQWSAFAVWLGDSAAGLAKSVASTLSGIGSGFTNEEYKAEMEDVFNPDQYLQTADAIKEVTAATQEKAIATQADLDALVQLKNANVKLFQSNADLRAEYQGVARDLAAAIQSGQAPTEELTARMEALRQKIYAVGAEAVYYSTFPDMNTAMRESQAQSAALTAEMARMKSEIKNLGKEYEATDKQIQDKQDTIRNINGDIREQQKLLRKASDDEKEGIRDVIVGLQNKKGEIQNEISDLQELSRDQKEARQAEQDALKESIQQVKEKQKANDELQKNMQRTADLVAKQQQEEAKAANDIYREQQKQAADSIKWISQLDDATKKRILGEQDAVKVLQAQGVELTDLQAQEVRRIQAAYKTEAAYEAQAKALEAQLGITSSLADNVSSLGSALSNIGGVFNIGGLGDIGGGLSALPDALKNIKESFAGLKGGLSGMTSGLSGLLGGITSITGAFSALSTAFEIGKAIWGGIQDLFKNTKSAGTEASIAFQNFLTKNVEGGAEMAAATKANFDAMSKANFDYQTFLQQTGSTMSQVMGGISQNWQQGTTAMDLFTQAVAASGVELSKAPQVALQAMAGFDQMGLSVEQAGVKMLEIAEAAGLSKEELETLKAALSQTASTASETSSALSMLSSDSVVASMGNMDEAVKRLQLRLVELGVSENEIIQRTKTFQESFGKNKVDDFVKTNEIAEALTQVVEGYRNAEGQIVDLTKSQYEQVSGLFQKLAGDQQLTVAEIQAYRAKLVELGIPLDELDQKLLTLGVTQEQLNTAMQGVSMATYNAGNEKAIEITSRLNAEAQQRITLWQNMGLSTDEINAKLADLGLTTEQILNTAFASTNPIVGALASAFDALSGSAALSAEAHTQLANSLTQVTADGQVTSAEIGSFVAELQAAGVPTDDLKNKILELAAASGVSETELQALQGALSGAGASADSYAAAVTNATTASQNSVSSNQSLAASTDGIAKGYANAADAIKGFAQAQQQAAINRNMQGLIATPTYHMGGIIPKYHTGGLIDWTAVQRAHSGTLLKRDEVPIIAQTGEAVLNRGAVSMLGVGGVNALNRGAMSGTVINVNITGNNITKDTDLRALAREVSAEISRSYRARA